MWQMAYFWVSPSQNASSVNFHEERIMCILILALLAVCPLYAQSPSVVFSEIMWMGSSASSADEWIALYNAGGSPQNL